MFLIVLLLLVTSRLGRNYLPAGTFQVRPSVDFGAIPHSWEGVDQRRLWKYDVLDPSDYEGGVTRAVHVPPHPGRNADIALAKERA